VLSWPPHHFEWGSGACQPWLYIMLMMNIINIFSAFWSFLGGWAGVVLFLLLDELLFCAEADIFLNKFCGDIYLHGILSFWIDNLKIIIIKARASSSMLNLIDKC
ncbi:hypothetical protein ACJX0J_023659, partial [Zea mays]